jgi:hypothetical protein
MARGRIAGLILALAMLGASLGCAKKAAVAPVPGAVNALDAWAYRSISDAGASVHSVKIWEQCSVAAFPPTVNVDGTTENCDPKSGMFPMQFKGDLNNAIQALNIAGAAGKAYHSGASNDTQGLTNAITQLTTAITTLLSHVGGVK